MLFLLEMVRSGTLAGSDGLTQIVVYIFQLLRGRKNQLQKIFLSTEQSF